MRRLLTAGGAALALVLVPGTAVGAAEFPDLGGGEGGGGAGDLFGEGGPLEGVPVPEGFEGEFPPGGGEGVECDVTDLDGGPSQFGDPDAPVGQGLRGTGPGPVVPKSLRSTGRFLVDQQGRVVVLHGTNQIRKLPPYTPSSIGFGVDDADQIVEEGFNTIRLGFVWKGLEPEPGQYDLDYLADLAGTVQLFTDRGVHVLFDMHQDMFNERYNGEGFPDWLLPDDEVPPVPDCGFPLNYFVMPALGLAYDNLLADEQLDALGRTPSEAYAEVWTLVAEQFRDDEFVFGYDVFNEPYPGADYAPCFNPEGCPNQDAELQAFQQAAVDAIRAVDPQTVVYYEPFLTFNAGADTSITDVGPDAVGGIGISFHVYCLGATPGLPVLPVVTDSGCEAIGDPMPLDNSLEQTELYGHVPLVTEFGATDDLPTLRRVSRLADDRLISWQHWAWFNEDVCCDRPNESIVRDPSQPPTGDNLGDDKLDQIVYPYPTAVAGTPTSYGFDHEADRFDLEFTTARADGAGTFPAGSITTVDVPPRQYPDGYRVIDVEGVEVVSEPGARTLEVATLEGVDGGSLAVVPPADGGTGGGTTDDGDDGSDGLGGGTGGTGGSTTGGGTGGTTGGTVTTQAAGAGSGQTLAATGGPAAVALLGLGALGAAGLARRRAG